MENFKFKCDICGKEHENEFSFGFNFPDHYDSLNEEERSKSKLSSDLCIIENDYFIRTVLEIPIRGTEEVFTWGVWVSQSKENYDYYVDHYNDDLSGRITFGWFCNLLPEYENTLELKTNVLFQEKKQRPKIEIQECEHLLYNDFINGITRDQAIEIFKKLLHKSSESSV